MKERCQAPGCDASGDVDLIWRGPNGSPREQATLCLLHARATPLADQLEVLREHLSSGEIGSRDLHYR